MLRETCPQPDPDRDLPAFRLSGKAERLEIETMAAA
jgi:hypothetical protein